MFSYVQASLLRSLHNVLRKKGDVITRVSECWHWDWSYFLLLSWTSYFTVAFYIPRTLRHWVSSSDIPWECGFAYDDTFTLYRSLTQSLIFRFLVTVAASAEWFLYVGWGGLVSYLGQSIGNAEEYPCYFRILPSLSINKNLLPVGMLNHNPSVSSLMKTNKQAQAKVFIF